MNQGALRGTAVHRVMECLDFKSLCDIDSRIKRENLGEELRVLYVALTRAKEKIILTGGLSNAQKSFEKYRGCLLYTSRCV